ncbi:MAG: DUF4747 family protein [Methylocystis sp.]
MASTSKIFVAALNVTASPHPEGTYRRLLEAAANHEIHLTGHDFAKLTPPDIPGKDQNIVTGRICVWTEIEKKEDWFNKKTNAAATDKDKESIVIPDILAPNFKYFLYAMDLARHVIVFEAKNEVRSSFNPKRARKFFDDLLNSLGGDFPDVDVTVIPEEGSVEKILSLPRLRRLKIVVTRPNGEDLTDEFAAVMAEMNEENAKMLTRELVKAPKTEALKPNETTRKLAMIASTNGYVEGKGSEGGDSTREHAKVVPVEVAADGSQIVRFVQSLLHFK